MRITNQMMVNNSLSNIQVNKGQLNNLSTQLSTQKKINKPSDDPIIAIRALRLRSSLDQVTQYLDKNIPDADSWLSVTHDALDEGYDIISDLYNYCVQGSTDSYSESERNTIGQSLLKLVNAFYSEGDVDYAGRHVFTGFNTDVPLTYQSDLTASDVDFTITQQFTRDDLSTKSSYTNAYTNTDIINLNVNATMPNVQTVQRIQLAYDEVNPSEFSITDTSGNVTSISIDDTGAVTTTGGVQYTDEAGAVQTATITSTTDDNYVPAAGEIAINATTGEVFLGEDVYKDIYEKNTFSITYRKDNFIKGDINPTMYFDCVDNNTGIEYKKEYEDIEYLINFSQKLKVNTEASDSFNIYLGRNVDDLVTAVNNVLDVDNQIEQVKSMLSEEQYSGEEEQKKLNTILEGLTKQKELAEDQMTKAFEKGLGQMQKYQEQISNAKADVGNRVTRLNLTKARLTEQKTNFTNLKSENEDIDLEEIVISYTSAGLVYQAALQAASKAVQETLLDFLG